MNMKSNSKLSHLFEVRTQFSTEIISKTINPNRSTRPKSTNLRDGVIPQINPRPHGQNRRGPHEERQPQPRSRRPPQHPDPFVAQQREVDGEEEHVLRVARRPAVGVAHLEGGAGLRPSLLDGGLDELIEDLGDEEAKGEEEALELAAEEEVGDESAEGDEDGDEGYPRQKVAEGVAAAVPDVG